jgi:hypothetical protein
MRILPKHGAGSKIHGVPSDSRFEKRLL